MHVLGIVGSLRRHSYNRSLLLTAGALLPPPSSFEIFDRLGTIPPFAEDEERYPPSTAVAALRRAVHVADALIVATPEYNASVPGAVKNAIDWASRPWPNNCLRGKPTLVIGTSVGLFGAVWAQEDMRRILRATGADVIDAEVGPVRAREAFDEQRRLVDAAVRERLDRAASALAERAATSTQAVERAAGTATIRQGRRARGPRR